MTELDWDDPNYVEESTKYSTYEKYGDENKNTMIIPVDIVMPKDTITGAESTVIEINAR